MPEIVQKYQLSRHKSGKNYMFFCLFFTKKCERKKKLKEL